MNVRLTALTAPLAARLRIPRPRIARRAEAGIYTGLLSALAVFGVLSSTPNAAQTARDIVHELAAPIASASAAIMPLGDLGREHHWPSNSWGLPERSTARGGLHFADAEALHSHLTTIGFTIDAVRSGGASVPRFNLPRLPEDMADLAETDKRKQVFIAAVLPLVLKSNERLADKRRELLALSDRLEHGLAMTADERDWLDGLAVEFDVDPVNLHELRRRVDVVPPSLALAQAVEESGWGTSRLAREANALFGQTTTPEYEHVVAVVGTPPQPVAFRAFTGLHASVESYMRNLNTHRAYAEFRAKRAQFRRSGKPLEVKALLPTLVRYSERGQDYVKGLATIIRANRLHDFDRARLSPPDGSPLPRRIAMMERMD